MKNTLKINLVILLFLGSFITLNAQSVLAIDALVSPSPIASIEDNGVGTGCFNFAESSGLNVPAESFPGIPNVTISMDLQFFELTNNDLSEVTGTLLEYFTPSYDQAGSILTFVQNQEIPADWSGSMCAGITVTQDSDITEIFNGFNVNISATDVNTNSDGNTFYYTYTNAPDTDGDGVPNSAEPTTALDPCLPAQAPGYTGYYADNAIWQQANCDGDGVNNGSEVVLGSDPYSIQNTITGSVLYDENGDGCDTDDNSLPFIRVELSDGTTTESTFLNNNANYGFYTQAGSFTVTPILENPSFFNVDPVNATINFPDAINNLAEQNFCITANGVHNDLEIVVAPTVPARPGFDAKYVITYKNKGNQTLSGDYSFAYDDTVLDYLTASEIPSTQATGLLTWNYQDLLPFESRTTSITLNVNSPMETPAVNIDDVLDFSVTINPITGDELPEDNQFDYEQIVVGSFDPNDITCLEGEFEDNTEIGTYLHYIINFENTGNFPAQNIIVETEVDPAMFNINSLSILSSSHEPVIQVENNKVRIIFESISLDTGGHGNILLKLKTQEDLNEDSTVTKNAEIFFDYNFPIETNDANTTFQTLLGNSSIEIDAFVRVYPNPVKDIFNISAINTINEITILDLQGRILQHTTTNSNEVKLDLSMRTNGVYFLQIVTDNGISVERIIKE